MEQALRIQPEEMAPSAPDRSRPETISEGIEKVLRFAAPPAKAVEQEAPPAVAKPAGPVTAREFATAIDFVHEAAQAIRAAEDRTREAEARTQALAQRAAEELKNSELRIQALEARVRAAEGRAQEAETRAKEADAWLRQIFTTIAEELPVRKSA
jgi:seryl-tRNA synthetase